MRAGLLRNYITIQENKPTRDATGAVVDNWVEFAKLYANIKPINGREYFSAEKFNAQVDTEITVRFVSGIKAEMRVLFGTRVYEIMYVYDRDERTREIKLFCFERIQ